MKKFIFTSIIGSVFVVTAFSFDNTNDSTSFYNNKVTSNVTNMSKPITWTANISQQPMPRNSAPNINQRNKQQVYQMTKKHLGRISEENLQAPRATRKYHKQNLADNNHGKQLDKYKNDIKNTDKEDQNPNLANLATPEPINIRNNIRISDEDKSLNRQMMMNGPQGGFQNNQPRGIGGTSTNF
ncbi:hypothetical protein ACH24_02180 [Francisella persica ATCC VR-331]|uniref:Uncharacterized protein n=1 Tax=Francisella persica ATCC VR-331 TaxID=1086726 RepID=A0AAC8VDD4_9GAMM|nr:hypothetical protein [Francisella persica]ALB01565.1 hypothetical protein ACH24_02180 [Francisella persica ATCC VR-331]ANH77862.1 hypothetical protein FSC845_05010 [Francisella persica ATCC VR-331]